MLVSFILTIASTLMMPGLDTTLTASQVTALKDVVPTTNLAAASSTVRIEALEQAGTYRAQGLSGQMPSLHMPEYGASLTSTIYIRGLGSRMENPVMGLYLDGIPVLDKNAYDFDWTAVRSATLLRGPQGTLYGRNAMGGVMALQTLSPSEHAAPVFFLEYGSARLVRVGGSFTKGQHAFAASFRHHDGFFPNGAKDNQPCDPYSGLQVHWKWEKVQNDLDISHLFRLSLSKEGGFAYGLNRDGVQYPVSYNDEGSYRRLSLLEGVRLKYSGARYTLEGTASLQGLADDMHMDQDYTAQSIFTLQQKQLSGAVTAEVLLRKADATENWQPTTGLFAFYRLNRLTAPVTFKREGTQTLILDNANKNIPEDTGRLDIPDETMPVNSDFLLGFWNAALFHESVYRSGDWILTAGLRLDYEGARMDYDCLAQLHYQFIPTMKAAKAFEVPYRGQRLHGRVQLLPKISALYEASRELKLYGTVARGYRSGGFNTQIFSDILQNRTMSAVMKDLGVYLDNPPVSVNAGNTEYDPEQAWNFETGLRYRKGDFKADAALYWLEVENQQITVFPPGKSTGRMMTNAGHSRSLGAETELLWTPGAWKLSAAYSWCDARFVRYHDGNTDYAGKRIPYIPAHTLYAAAGYQWELGNETSLRCNVALRGNGPFCWNEDNTREEPFSLRLDARIGLRLSNCEIYLRGENLTDTRSNVFYFKSMGNEFFAAGKPRILITGITIKL